MKKWSFMLKLAFAVILLFPQGSCKKLKDYFRDPDTEALSGTIHSAVLTGYAASVAMAVMNGQSFANVTFASRSNPGFPCTTLMEMETNGITTPSFLTGRTGSITIAGLWADASTVILTLIFTDYHTDEEIFDLVGLETIPVILDGNDLHVALAHMDIQLNPDQQSLLQINLTTLEIESELLRLDAPRPADIYVAVTQDAYFVDVHTNGTSDNPADDSYTLTGGGQLIEATQHTAEIVQQAMVEVEVSPECSENPVGGMALVKVTGVESEGFPELGTALLECRPACDGEANVFAATGMYAGSNGQKVPFKL